MSQKVKFGAVVPTGFLMDLSPERPPSENFASVIRTAVEMESLGFDGCWSYDHFYPFPKISMANVFELWTTLSAISQRTSRLRLGQIVTCNGYRNPALLAKMAATLDVMSNGRLDFGIGAGWYEEEYKAYGFEYPPASKRIGMLEESVQIIKKMWTEDRPTFQGKYYSINEAINSPKPVQKPHPPILIGGTGEKLTLKVVAKFADRCNIDYNSYEESKAKLDVLKRHCEDVGRNYDSIEKTMHRWVAIARTNDEARKMASSNYRFFIGHKRFPEPYSLDDYLSVKIWGSPEQCIKQIKNYQRLGITYFILMFLDSTRLEPLRMFANEVMPAFQ